MNIHSISSASSTSTSHYEVLAIGTAYFDITARTTKAFVETLNLPETEWSRETDHRAFATLLDRVKESADLFQTLGGSAGNVVRTLQGLGCPTAFFCKAGDDAVSAEYKKAMESLGVHVIAQPSENPVSRILVLVDEHNRKFVVNQTLSTDLSPDILSKKMFEGVKALHFEGYTVGEFQPAFLELAMVLAKAKGVVVTFDLGADFVVKSHKDIILRLLPHVDVLFANEAEVNALAESLSIDISQVSSFLLDSCPVVIFLEGAEGATVFSRNSSPFTSPANSIPSDTLLDTNGAGDAFIAGFLHGYLTGHELVDCAWMGNLLGSKAVCTAGAQIPLDTLPSINIEIEDYLKALEEQQAVV